MNHQADQPYQHSVYYMTFLISEKGWTKRQLLHAIEDFTVDDLQQFIPKLLTQNVFIESIMYGNLTEQVKMNANKLFIFYFIILYLIQTAKEYLKIVEDKLKSTNLIKCDKLRPLEKIHLNNFRQVKLPDGCNYVYLKPNTVHKTNAIEVYYQCGVQNSRDNALVELFCQVVRKKS
jgi:insulysin